MKSDAIYFVVALNYEVVPGCIFILESYVQLNIQLGDDKICNRD